MKQLEDTTDYARETVACDPFATFLGIRLLELSPGHARLSLEVKPEYCNSVERAHGAAVYAAADQAFAVACNSCGHRAMALSVTINYLAGAAPGTTIISEASPVAVRRKVSLWNLEVKTEDGELIATARGTAYHK